MMLVTVWVFIGIEGASVYSQRAAKRKDVGRATVLGFAGVLALLLMVNLLSYGLMAQAELAGVPDPSMAGVLENEVGSWGAAFISDRPGHLAARRADRLGDAVRRDPAPARAGARDAQGAGPRERPRCTGKRTVADQPVRAGAAAVDARQREHLHQPGVPGDVADPVALPVVCGLPGVAGGPRRDLRHPAVGAPATSSSASSRSAMRCGWCTPVAGSTCWSRPCSISSARRCTSGRARKAACRRSPSPKLAVVAVVALTSVLAVVLMATGNLSVL